MTAKYRLMLAGDPEHKLLEDVKIVFNGMLRVIAAF
jgi:hypothetical protein